MIRDQIKDFIYAHFSFVREDGDEYAVLCPFHANFDTPALYVNKETGLWHCFNPTCAKRGRFATLVKDITGEDVNFEDALNEKKIERWLKEPEKIEEVDQGFDEAMDRLYVNYNDNVEVEAKLGYLLSRGFNKHTLQHFEVGFSELQNRIVIPVRDENFKVVGFIGRSIDEETMPKYKYTDHFPRRNLLLNLCNAKQFDYVIVVEGSLDHMKIFQAGYPSVVSTMGSTVTENQIDLLNRYFSQIILFSDFDEAGDKMKHAIMEGCPRKDLWVVQYDGVEKDPGEMSEEQIQKALKDKITYLEYKFNELTKEKK